MDLLNRNKNIETRCKRPKSNVFSQLFIFSIRNIKSTFYSLVLSVFLISCQEQHSTFDVSKVFRYNEHSNITSLDPAFAKDQRNIWATNQLYNGLVQLDDSLHVQPSIAKSWQISEDGKVYTFLLKNDVYFHKHHLFGKDSTRVVIAGDFEYSFNRLLDKNVVSPGGWVLQNVKSFKALDAETFQIELKQPFPPFLGLLAMKYCSVVSKEAIEYFGNEYRSNPIGTGPFLFKLWVENTKLVLRKNPSYFEKDTLGNSLPYLEAVTVTFLPDKQSEFLQFIQGNLDFMKSLDASYKDDIITTDGKLQEKYINTVHMETGAYLNTEYLGLYLDSDDVVINNKLIRKAINYGFNRRKMITYLRNGIGTPAVNGFIPAGLPSFNGQKGYEYNPEKATKLINQFVQESGIDNPSITITTNSNYLDLCEFIQRELEKVGLDVIVDVIPPSTLRQGKANGKFPVFRASWIADYPDAENYLSLFYSKNFTPNGPNYTHFKNDVFDQLYEQSISEVDTKIRYKLYQKNVQGLGINPIDMLDLRRVRKIKD